MTEGIVTPSTSAATRPEEEVPAQPEETSNTNTSVVMTTPTPNPPQQQQQQLSVGMMEMVIEYLEGENRRFSKLPPRQDGSQVLEMNLSGNNASFRTYIDLKLHQDRMLVFVESPVKIHVSQRSAVAELLMRINYTLALGCFEIDFRDGEVRYRMAVDVEGSRLSRQMIETNIMVPAATMDRYFPVMMAVFYANKDPEEALTQLRNAQAVATLSPASSSQ